MADAPLTLFAPDPEVTDAIGAALAPLLAPGDVVTLTGGLGAGKSALARALIRARLKDPDLEVPSPSFALVQPYPGLLHADLYRLADESEVIELGLFDTETDILLIEWPDRAPELMTRPGLAITLAIPANGAGRTLSIAAQGAREPGALRAALAAWTVAP